MSAACKLSQSALLAFTVAAVAAPFAPAQVGEPMLHNQAPRLVVAQEAHAANDVACPAVTPSPPPNPGPTITVGGCRSHYSAANVVQASHLTAGGTEVVVSACDWEFDLRLDSAAEGYIAHQELTQGTQGTCTRKACGQVTPPTSEGRAWTLYLQETEVAGQGPREGVRINLCTEPIDPGTGSHCVFNMPVSQTSTHRYGWTATDVPGEGTFFPHCELTGTFDQEAALGTTGEGQLEQNIEIRHT